MTIKEDLLARVGHEDLEAVGAITSMFAPLIKSLDEKKISEDFSPMCFVTERAKQISETVSFLVHITDQSQPEDMSDEMHSKCKDLLKSIENVESVAKELVAVCDASNNIREMMSSEIN